MISQTDPFGAAFLQASTPLVSSAIAAQTSAEYVQSVQSAIDRLEDAILKVTTPDKGMAFLQGDAAEVWHAETYNVDAARLGLPPLADAPRETISHGPDVVFGPERSDPAQLKYYANPEATARAVADPGYQGMTLVVPADQFSQVTAWLQSRAEATSVTNPELSHRYADAAVRVSDHLARDGAVSIDLTRSQAEDLVRDAAKGSVDLKDLGLRTRDVIHLSDEFREVAKHTLEAAAIAVALQLTGFVIASVQRALDEGSLSQSDFAELAEGRGSVVAKSAFTGVLAGSVALAAGEGFLGEAAKALAPETISLLVVLAVNSAISAYRAGTGAITWIEAAHQMARTGTTLAGATVGALIGSTVAPGIGTILGSVIGGALTQQAFHQGERLLMAVSVSRGWTYFGLVHQDYQVPESTLVRLGWDTVTLDRTALDEVDLETPSLDRVAFEPPELDAIHYLRRGVIAVRRVGYISA